MQYNKRVFIYLSQEDIDQVPRNFHTIKGSAIKDVTHRLHGVRCLQRTDKCKVQVGQSPARTPAETHCRGLVYLALDLSYEVRCSRTRLTVAGFTGETDPTARLLLRKLHERQRAVQEQAVG